MRIRNAWRLTVAGLRTMAAGVAREVGRDELFLAAGLGLLGYGLSLTPWPPVAFIVPGAVLVWMALPPRRPFVVTPADIKDRRN
ncbi:MAG: hypothetical protein AB7Q16_06040 [Vicinamibacterales bacterium]